MVAVRSYSCCSRVTSLDSETGMPGQLRAEDRAEPLLVGRVEVRVQQADGDRLDARGGEPGRERAGLVLVERLTTVPSAAIRSAISKRSRRGTSDGGFVQK